MPFNWWPDDRSHWTRTGVVAATVLSAAALVLTALVAWAPWTDPVAPVSDGNPLPVRIVPGPEGAPQGAPDDAAEAVPSGGWGPDRPVFTSDSPPRFPVFNSIIDNPAHGDERNFVQCRDLTNDEPWEEELVVRDGHIYEIYIYFANDIANSLDDGNEAAVIQNATVHAVLPSESTTNPYVQGMLQGDNVPKVWDSCNFHYLRPSRLIYQIGSARLFAWGTPDAGLPLPEVVTDDDVVTAGIVVTGGAPLGYTEPDGIVRASPDGAGYVTLQVQAIVE